MSITRVDVVIPTCGRGGRVSAAVESIRASTHTDFTLWVVDQSDDSVTEEALAPHCREDARVRYVRSRSRGSNRGRDEGVRAGTAPYILFTDDDCRVHHDWVRRMTAELANEETSAVFGQVLPEEESSHGEEAVSPSVRLAVKKEPQRRVFEGNRFRLDFGHGANMGVRRDAYDAAGGFDLLLGCGGPLRAWPERDFGYRVLASGGRIVYAPQAVVHHRQWRDWAGVRSTCRNYAFGAGAVAGKYLRCGDWGGAYLLGEWIVDQGARQVLSGVFKWQSRQKIEVGLLQVIYPWVGLWYSLRYAVDRGQRLYQDPTKPHANADLGADTAVAHFSAAAKDFNELYQASPEFKERLELWRALLDEHAVPGGRTVDLGCGSGIFSAYVAEKGGSVVGVDGAPDMIELCNQRRRALGLDNLEFRQGVLPNIETADLEEADLVVCSSVLEYVEDLDAALGLLAQLVRPGGTVLLSMPNLLCLNRLYGRAAHKLLGRSPIYRYIRHFTTPDALAKRVRRHDLTLERQHYYDHHTRLGALMHRWRLPASLTEDLFVAVLRKDVPAQSGAVPVRHAARAA